MTVTKKQLKNLIPLNQRSERERKEIQRKGAQAANEVKRKKKTMKQIFQTIGDLEVTDPKLKERLKSVGLHDEDITWSVAVAVSTILNAIKKNDIKTVEFVLEMMDNGD